MNGCKLSPIGLGLALGVLWGLSVFLLGLLAYWYTFGKPFVDAMATLYMGYEPSITGSIIGGVIGFIDAFITGALIAWLYNKFSGCHCNCCADTAVVEKKKAK